MYQYLEFIFTHNMKTQDLLKELKAKNIRVPENWAVLQSSAGEFLGFMPCKSTKEDIEYNHKMFRDAIEERIRAEREAIKESKLSKL